MSITADQKHWLNRMNKIASYVQLGTLIENAEAVTASEITLAQGSVLVGNASGVSAALDASGDGKVLIGNGTTATSVSMSGDVAITNAGVTSIAKLAGTEDIDSKLYIGESGTEYAMTTGDNVIGIYAEDSTGTGYSDGVSSSVKASGGDGGGAVRAVQALGEAASGADLAELYGGSFYAIQRDGSGVASNIYGVMGYCEIEETDAADDPTGYICGLLGIYDTNGVNPSVTLTTPGFKAAIAGVVKDNANSVPHAAVMAFMEGDATGTSIGAAFKAVSVRSTAGGGFDYGLDLYDEAGYGENIQTADIRFNDGTVIKAGETSGTTLIATHIEPTDSTATGSIDYHRLFCVGDSTGTTAYGFGDATKPTYGAMFSFGRDTTVATSSFTGTDTSLDVRAINKLVNDGAYNLQGAYIKAKNYSAGTVGTLKGLYVECVADGTDTTAYALDIGGDSSTIDTAIRIGSLTATNAIDISGATITNGADIKMSSGIVIASGSGAPSFTAAQGSIYLRTGQAANATLYINTDGLTTWTLMDELHTP